MIFKMFLHLFFISLPWLPLFVYIPPTVEGRVFCGWIMMMLSVGTYFLIFPFIETLFKYQYKKFLFAYKNGSNSLPQYSNSSHFYCSIYNHFGKIAGLDGWEEYSNDHSKYKIRFDMILTLIHMNRMVKQINKIEHSKLVSSLNIFPNKVFMSSNNKKRLKELLPVEQQPQNEEKTKIMIPNHLEEEILK